MKPKTDKERLTEAEGVLIEIHNYFLAALYEGFEEAVEQGPDFGINIWNHKLRHAINKVGKWHSEYEAMALEEEKTDSDSLEVSKELLNNLKNIRQIIVEGAMVGFNPLMGDWADKLYESQSDSFNAVESAEKVIK